VLPVPPVRTRCRRCLTPSSPFHTPPLATGPDVVRPHLLATHARVARAPLPSPFRSALTASMPCQPTSLNPRPLLRFSPPRGVEHLGTPTPPLPPPPPLQKESAAAPHSLLFPPSLSSAHGHASITCFPPFPASRPRR
jgi:hypothetical protein